MEADKILFNTAALDLKEMLQRWHDDTLELQLESLSPTASNKYSQWKFTKNYSKAQSTKFTLKTGSGWARTSQEKVNAYANHQVVQIFSPNLGGSAENEPYIDEVLLQDFQISLPPRPFTVPEVWRVIIKLKDKKAPGPYHKGYTETVTSKSCCISDISV